MTRKKDVFIVLLCLLPAALVYLLFTGDKHVIKEEQQLKLINDAQALEESGSYLMAYRQYHIVNSSNGHLTEYMKLAGKKYSQMGQIIHAACDIVDKGIKQYFLKHGAYPKTLDIFRDQIPKSSLIAFNDFKLSANFDGKIGVDCGFYGPINILI